MENNTTDENEEKSVTFHEQLSALREQLEKGDLLWPETSISQLVQSINQIDSGIEQEDMDMLSLAVDAALHDVDILQVYPQFYQRMMMNKTLYQMFTDMVAVIQDKSPLPDVGSVNLSFLDRHISKPPVVITSGVKVWEATWQLVAETLNQLLPPTSPSFAYRSEQGWLDEDSTLLLYNEFVVDENVWQATMEALTQPERPGMVELILSVTTDERLFSPLEAAVQWGDYQETAVSDAFGRIHFPPLPINQVLNDDGSIIPYDLRLNLHPIDK